MTASARFWKWFWLVVIAVPLVVFVVWANITNPQQFVSTLLNGVTLAALYFLVASGFTLIFGLMRNVNLAHGSLYLFGAYMGWIIGEATDNWFLAIAIGCILWWFLNRTRVGMMIRAGVDDRGMLAASGVNVQRVFAITFAIGAGL